MNQCPYCGKEFEGKFCPECGNSLTNKRLCPNCKALVPSGSKFCPECGFALVPQKQPSNNTASAWIQAHKKHLVWGVVALIIVLLGIGIPYIIVNRHNGTYYHYENGEYNYEKYYVFEGNTYTDELGYSCDLKFDGDQVEMYGELFGVKDVVARGTIEDDILKLEIMGAEAIYAKKGHTHTLKDEVIKEATCEEDGSSIASCACGYREKEPKIIPALGHDFNKNQFCKRCGMGTSVLLEFTLNEKESTYSVTGMGLCNDTDIIIPNKHNGLPVTSIGEEAFYQCAELKSISIPESVVSIGKYAFCGCTGLTSITIPNSMISIKNGAFYYCNGLTSITIPDSVTFIGEGAFRFCYNLQEVTFKNPNGWTADETALSGLENPEKAAEKLTETYTSASWTRS